MSNKHFIYVGWYNKIAHKNIFYECSYFNLCKILFKKLIINYFVKLPLKFLHVVIKF